MSFIFNDFFVLKRYIILSVWFTMISVIYGMIRVPIGTSKFIFSNTYIFIIAAKVSTRAQLKFKRVLCQNTPNFSI